MIIKLKTAKNIEDEIRKINPNAEMKLTPDFIEVKDLTVEQETAINTAVSKLK